MLEFTIFITKHIKRAWCNFVLCLSLSRRGHKNNTTRECDFQYTRVTLCSATQWHTDATLWTQAFVTKSTPLVQIVLKKKEKT